MKWRPSEPSEGEIHTEIPDKMITWAHNNGKTVRGHALLWAKRSNNPDWVQNLYGEDLKTAVFNRLDFAVNHYEQYNVPHWDVINEMVNEGAENHTFFLIYKSKGIFAFAVNHVSPSGGTSESKF